MSRHPHSSSILITHVVLSIILSIISQINHYYDDGKSSYHHYLGHYENHHVIHSIHIIHIESPYYPHYPYQELLNHQILHIIHTTHY